ncbi:aminotransferase class V-fold PLP-dependent enzyme [Chitinophaga pendula]|uniref:aminotransferase class V-fold PLP-dependent enzyme n=1 Tax=Chitinophaga TaxID=79328 RepID=UPI000BAF3C4F|nr:MULTISPECIES: aminotransferase class V-fold PLP-dependent enzyme [Chitinophaga]ASZ12502.1 selenocysteine lyase [Chitinophaga sp. MD30]UCJ09894.1 aminotransferase class V-fold PLP-dependent enzyme [Chitinophaga pendula]
MFPVPISCESASADYFSVYRKQIIGQRQYFETPYGQQKLLYADWTASGRAYGPIEMYIQQEILPFAGNTHTHTTITGTLMSAAYAEAKVIVKAHVNAGADDILLFCGSGMTSAVNKLQRILGLRLPDGIGYYGHFSMRDAFFRPVVFITSMEHHSNHISWLETIATVVIIGCDQDGQVDLAHFAVLLEEYRDCPNKIAAVTACSNVTGIVTPYHEIAKLIHRYGGVCFVDFACSAPYCDINMHPDEYDAHLDAIYFSSHKFLGGPGTPGVLLFSKDLYRNRVPDHPGGGTVHYSNPWQGREYVADIEEREDGGTPPFLQGIKAGMCIRLKEAMGVPAMLQRERELLAIIFPRLSRIPQLQVLQSNMTDRLGVVSFTTGIHYNLFVRLLNDRFGIQMRGGCSCAGTYGHLLLDVGQIQSYAIWDAIRSGDLLQKPGWVRLSIHPTMTDAEIHFILDAIEEIVANIKDWEEDYYYDTYSNEYYFKTPNMKEQHIGSWFEPGNWQVYTTR